MKIILNDIDKIKKRLKLDPQGEVQKFFTNECYKRMDEYVPMDKGHLRTIVDIQADSITYEVPYASYQYRGEREDGSHKIYNYTTPGTGPYWDKRMVSAEIDDLVEKIEQHFGFGGK